MRRRAIRVDGRHFAARNFSAQMEIEFNARTKDRTSTDDDAAPEVWDENADSEKMTKINVVKSRRGATLPDLSIYQTRLFNFDLNSCW